MIVAIHFAMDWSIMVVTALLSEQEELLAVAYYDLRKHAVSLDWPLQD